MSIWYPRIAWRQVPLLIGITVFGAVLAGSYGALHDQISYSISPEYFSKMKFKQFAWADLGWPNRLFVALIGFIGSCWAGVIAGWLLARLGLADLWAAGQRKRAAVAVAMLIAITAVCGALGAGLGATVGYSGELEDWREWRQHVDDPPSFIVVAYLHWGSYLGAVIGTVCALVYVRIARRASTPG